MERKNEGREADKSKKDLERHRDSMKSERREKNTHKHGDIE